MEVCWFETNFALKSSFLIKRKVTVHKGWEREKESWSFNYISVLMEKWVMTLLFVSQANQYFHLVTHPTQEVITQSATKSFVEGKG